MPFQSMVLYPNDPDATFDMQYYLSKHMPLVVMEHWGKHGLKEWSVIKYTFALPDGAKPPYSVCAQLLWETSGQLEAALAHEDSKVVFGDIENFSNRQPVFVGGTIVGTSSGGNRSV